MAKKKSNTAEMKAAMMKQTTPRTVKTSDLLSTGSTLLNLACSGKVDGGFAKGHCILFVGDSDSGKTWLSMTCLAEATINEEFKDHRLIFDNAENGALMDLNYYFGDVLADKLESPAVDTEGRPLSSRTGEEFYFNVDDALEDGRPFIYVLDSMDVLTSDADDKRFDEHKTADRKGKDKKGTYGLDKPKLNASNLRKVVGELERTDSILLIVNQTRDNIDPMPFTPKKTRSGGWALVFYSHLVLWSSCGSQIKKTVNDKPRQIGVNSKVAVKRSRITGKKRMVDVPIYHSIGIDDVGSCVDFLCTEKRWKRVKGKISVTGLGPAWEDMTVQKVIKKIEDGDLYDDLKALVQEVWDGIEAACRIERRNKYSGGK